MPSVKHWTIDRRNAALNIAPDPIESLHETTVDQTAFRPIGGEGFQVGEPIAESRGAPEHQNPEPFPTVILRLDDGTLGTAPVNKPKFPKPTFPIWLKSFLSNSSMVFQPLSNYGPFLRVSSYNNSMICHFAVICRKHHGGT